MPTLHAGPLLLEPLQVAHAPEMFALLQDPALYHYLDYPPPPSLAHLEGVYTRLQARRSPDGRQRWLNWVVRAPPAGLIGYVQATVGPDASAWVGYVLGRAAWGQGHATRATRCMLEHLVAHDAVQRFLATVEQANERSIALLDRLGFSAAGPDERARHELSATERLFVADPASLRRAG